jgi:preprotein translocase subunit SecG
MFKEPAYWMYYFWSKNKRARKDKAVISNATWTMAILWLLNLLHSTLSVREENQPVSISHPHASNKRWRAVRSRN